ncbi:MAG: MFS transporter [Phocaeicola plebeius]
MKKNVIFPILFGFFVMGFVDVVGIATNYIQQDFSLPHSVANLLPMAVFLWFAVCSVPTGLLMNRYGKKTIVCASLLLTLVAMLFPLFAYSYPVMLLSFALLGISNTALQVSLNPLAATAVRQELLASILTWGQFVKAISSFLGPIIAGSAALYTGQWKLIFALYALITLLNAAWVAWSVPATHESSQTATFRSTLSLFADGYILRLFIGILVIVGIDVGLNTAIPKLLMEKTGMPLEQAGLGTSLYFFARTAGTFAGALLLARWQAGRFLRFSMIAALAALAALFAATSPTGLYTGIVVAGLAFANVFSIVFAYALQYQPERNNDISSLMVMGVAGGALFPPLMGLIADHGSQALSLIILTAGTLYLLTVTPSTNKTV